MATSAAVETPIAPEADLDEPNVDKKLEPLSSPKPPTGDLGKPGDPPPKGVPLTLPFASPSPSATKPVGRIELTPHEQSAYDQVLNHLKSIAEFPVSSSKKNTERAPLSESEKYFLSKECILRYLRATKWNIKEAQKRLEGTIVWRREYGTDTLTAEIVEPEV
jgi:hypothetical protein